LKKHKKYPTHDKISKIIKIMNNIEEYSTHEKISKIIKIMKNIDNVKNFKKYEKYKKSKNMGRGGEAWGNPSYTGCTH